MASGDQERVQALREILEEIDAVDDYGQHQHDGPGDPGGCYPCGVKVLVRAGLLLAAKGESTT